MNDFDEMTDLELVLDEKSTCVPGSPCHRIAVLAERYLFLRDCTAEPDAPVVAVDDNGWIQGEELDRAIDEAMGGTN